MVIYSLTTAKLNRNERELFLTEITFLVTSFTFMTLIFLIWIYDEGPFSQNTTSWHTSGGVRKIRCLGGPLRFDPWSNKGNFGCCCYLRDFSLFNPSFETFLSSNPLFEQFFATSLNSRRDESELESECMQKTEDECSAASDNGFLWQGTGIYPNMFW